jgi:hypothetical protein
MCREKEVREYVLAGRISPDFAIFCLAKRLARLYDVKTGARPTNARGREQSDYRHVAR